MSPLLPPGSRIRVVAPSGIGRDDRLAAGLHTLRAWGWHVDHPEPLQQPHRYLAGTDAQRLTALTGALTAPGLDAVWLSRGGYGITRLLDDLPWDAVVPGRVVLGFSDATPLLEALRVRTEAVPVHAPVVHSLPITDAASLAALRGALQRDEGWDLPGETWVEGEAQGPVVGGNLAMMAATCGTPWQVDGRGAIVLIEDVAEPAYKLDRMLVQLRSAGVFDGAVGVAVGTFEGCRAPEGADWSVEDVVREGLAGLGVPVVGGLAVGHGGGNRAVRMGGIGRLAAGLWAVAEDRRVS